MSDEQGEVGGPDPASIRSIAVTAEDVISAVEAAERGRERVVLRITPPFYGRMRARIHLEGGEGEYDGDVAPIHLGPEAFVDDDAPAYPDVDETEDRLRERGEYDVETHREAHEAAVEEWRTALRQHVVDAVTLQTADGSHRIDVKLLG
jgi:hypothetical protein